MLKDGLKGLEKQVEECITHAYDKGYKDGELITKTSLYDEHDQKTAYEEGLKDAWETARKIIISSAFGGYDRKTLQAVFSSQSPSYIFEMYSALDAIAKIKEYEAGQNDIKIGDELYSEMTDSKAVVQYIDAWGSYHCLNSKGTFVISKDLLQHWVKTGRTFPQIAEIMKQMDSE